MSLGKELGFLPWRNLVCVCGGGAWGTGVLRKIRRRTSCCQRSLDFVLKLTE